MRALVPPLQRSAVGAVLLLLATGLVLGAGREFYNIAWGTGSWWGEFSAKWALAFVSYVAIGAVGVVALAADWRGASWPAATLLPVVWARERLVVLRWIVIGLMIVSPILLFQYSAWGVVVRGPFLRCLLSGLAAIVIGVFLTRGPREILSRRSALVAMVCIGSSLVVAAAFTFVTRFPFSLGWSEGNRLWDYSLLFGLHRYDYPSGRPPVAYLDIGRQFLGGLPFLLPDVSIQAERAWLAALAFVPYLLLGLITFRRRKQPTVLWLVAGLWSMEFLSQGPIHPPLVLCAIGVALAWRQRTWLAAVIILLAGYAAEISRFTWMFAPAMWIVMLEVGGAPGKQVPHSVLKRAAILGAAGTLGGLLAFAVSLATNVTAVGPSTAASTRQPLLWYRLLPNATYGSGILAGLLLAVGPLVMLLAWAMRNRWLSGRLQRLALILPLLAFLAVGLIVSTKIGGGGDLHNLDMFLIALLFSAALAWHALVERTWSPAPMQHGVAQVALALLVMLPPYAPLMAIRPINFAGNATWLAALADVDRPRDLGSLPPESLVAESLQQLTGAIGEAIPKGDVLFMDQRQLLTFGFTQHVPLVSEYEKKRLMDEALGSNSSYFRAFYADLARHRFSLIISSPLRTPIRDSEYGFSEENNAWVRWVARPILCYYEELDTLDDVKVELLVPRQNGGDCSTQLP